MKTLASWVLAAALAGCSSPQAVRFHTLLPSDTPPVAAPAASPIAWELLPIGMAPSVSQPQLVVRAGDDTLAVLEQERWIAPLADELRAAVAERLAQRVGRPPPGNARWRIRVDVLRFESVPQGYARLVADWELRSTSGVAFAASCRGVFDEPATAGINGVVAAHRRAAQRLADAIADALLALNDARVVACPK